MNKKAIDSEITKTASKYIECSRCLSLMKVDENADSGLCWRCTMAQIPFVEKKPTKTNRPRGWIKMRLFVDQDGTVYERGVENEALKGTYPKTDVKKIKAQQKKKKDEKEKEKKRKLKKEQDEINKRNKNLTDSGYAKKKRKK